MTKKKRSCQLPTDEDRGGDSEKGDITWSGEKKEKSRRKEKRKRKRSMKLEQKKSAGFFYCIELKLVGERRKRTEGGGVGMAPWMRK